MTLAEARALVQTEQQAGKTVVFTNGVFDVLHVGHVRYLEQARQLGDRLIVGLNSDTSTRAIKGDARPLVPEADRQELLVALRCVDAVVIFDEPTAEAIVEALHPDIYVKGGDYQIGQLPEAAVVQRYGGQVRVLLEVKGRSTTDLIETVKQRFCP